MTAAAPSAQFGSLDRDNFDTSFAQFGIGIVVAIVSPHHTGLQRNHIIAIIPLLPLSL